MKSLEKAVENLNSKINSVIDDLIKKDIQPEIDKICKKHDIVFLVGNGTYSFYFKKNDVRDTIYDLSDILCCIDDPVEWVKDNKADILEDNDFLENEDIIEYIQLLEDVIPLYNLLLSDIGGGFDLAAYCYDSNHK